MMLVVKKAGRPMGVPAQAVLQLLLSEGPMTARTIGERLQLSIRIVWVTCSRLVARGEIEIVRRRQVEGVNKPVAVYAARRRTQCVQGISRLPMAFFAER